MNQSSDQTNKYQPSPSHSVTAQEFAHEILLALKEFFFGSFSLKSNAVKASFANGDTFLIKVDKL